MKFQKLLWILGKDQDKTSKPMLVGITASGNMHWNAGITYTTWNPSEYVIVREFDYIDDDSITHADDALLEAYAPKPQEPCARLGWISPSGEWYPCGYACHSDVGYLLLRYKYQSSYPDLGHRGWIEVKGGALIVVDSAWQTTEEAKNTLRRVVEAFEMKEALEPDVNWDEVLLANPENYSESGWVASPTQWCGSSDNLTYAQRLREVYELYFGEEQLVNADDFRLVEPSAYKIRRPGEHPGD